MFFIVKNLSIFHGDVLLAGNLSFYFEKGDLVALMGPNGAGKTTLLNTWMGLHKNFKGSWGWFDSLHQESPYIHKNKGPVWAYLPQRSDVNRYFPLSVHEVVRMGQWSGTSLFSKFSCSVESVLEKVRLTSMSYAPISSLSGGQFQRMLLARLLIQNPQCLLLDEPFVGIDELTLEILMGIIEEWHQQGRTLVIAQHNRSHVLKHFPKTLLLSKKFYRWGHTEDVLTLENIAQAYDAVAC